VIPSHELAMLLLLHLILPPTCTQVDEGTFSEQSVKHVSNIRLGIASCSHGLTLPILCICRLFSLPRRTWNGLCWNRTYLICLCTISIL